MTVNPPELAIEIADRLGQIDGIIAVVLGGSQARGDAQPNSDIDLGLYYDPTRPPLISALRSLARDLDDRHTTDLVVDFGEWGPWINGGGWLDIQGQRVDWLYRDLARVETAISDCEAGRVACYYQPGHPHGFYNHIYMGEVFTCLPLYERDERLAALKSRTVSYPLRLKQALIQGLWEAEFSLENCHKPATRGDVVQVTGLLYRAVAVMVQALFALNERYCINEKGAALLVKTMQFRPPEFTETVSAVLSAPGRTADELHASVDRMHALLMEVQTLCQR